jgi:flagellar hook-associated protein 3 FlgL
MKVATRTIYDNIVANLFQSADKLQELNRQVTTGKRINQPSDDPLGAAMALDLRTVLRELDQYKKNIDSVNAQLSASESVLMDINGLLTKAKELAAQMATETYSAENRRAVAVEVMHISEEIMQLANGQLNGAYLFSGYSTDKEAVKNDPAIDFMVGDPVVHQASAGTVAVDAANTNLINQSYPAGAYLIEITEDTADAGSNVKFKISTDGGVTWALTTYDGVGDVAAVDPIVGELDGIVLDFAGTFSAGDRFTIPIHQYALTAANDRIEVNVGRSTRVRKNVTATSALEYQSGRTLFDALDDLRASLITNNTEGIAASMADLSQAQDNLLNQLADVGERLNRMDIREELHAKLKLQTEQWISNVEDVDLIEAMTNLSNQQVAYQAVLQSSAMISRVSLMDYI